MGMKEGYPALTEVMNKLRENQVMILTNVLIQTIDIVDVSTELNIDSFLISVSVSKLLVFSSKDLIIWFLVGVVF